jgi:4-carboxymuconolactone decarboxylase
MADEASGMGDYERGVELMGRLWGEATGAQMRELWRLAHPDVERYITGFALGEIWARPSLDLKTRSLVCLAAAVALEREGQVKLHTRGALQSGASPDEIAETIIQLMIYAGFPAAWQAMLAAGQVIAEHQAERGG